MEYHEAANIFPLMEGVEFKLLCNDIATNGLMDVIAVYDGKILDGRNRYRACTEVGIVPHFEYIDGDTDPLQYVISKNLQRRHLNESQRAMIAARLANKKAGDNQYGHANLHDHQPIGKNEAARMLNVSPRSVASARQVLEQASPDVIADIDAGNLVVSKYERMARRQDRISETPTMPDGKYNVIYADPPWQYTHGLDIHGAADRHYSTLSIQELCELPIKELAEDNAVLFLWVTSPKLFDAIEIVKAWGFEYKTSFVWDKVKHVMGHYNSVRHEFLLICTRGSFPKQSDTLHDSVISIERSGEHSEKPEYFRELIEGMYPQSKKIELFARKKTDAWDCWGNEL